MCGIVGFFNYNTVKQDQSVTILRRMLTRIKHRGPDESGIYLSDVIGLGSVRLSIVGLKDGTMPLSNSDGTLWVVFNGEIYNHIELRKELESKNNIFKTHSDTEVIVYLYEEYGPEFVQKLNGQFAIAIWDKTKAELFLVRDRVGIRPLYYTKVGNAFVFASEVKSMLEFPGFIPKLSPKAISDYFTFWTALSPDTVFEDVFEVPPGTYIIINKDSKKSTIYWELPLYKPTNYKYTNINEAVKDFDSLFSDAVKLRLRADVQVAAYLSGGLDSCVITSFIKKISPDKLQTFSIGFSEKEYDESAYQNSAANYFKTEHSSVVCSSTDIAENFKDVVWHAEAPLLRTSPAPMHMLAKSVRDQNIKVVLTGEGADELLCGYNIFKETKIRQFWAKDPSSKYRPLLLKTLYPYLPQMKNANNNVLKMFFGYKLKDTTSPIYSHVLRWHNTSRINNYLSPKCKDAIADYNSIGRLEEKLNKKFKDLDSLSKAQYIELTIFMSGYLLSSQGDRMAMANSVEGRFPFLDHRIIEFCMSIHPDLKLNGLDEKHLLKRLMKNKLPDEILKRPKQAYRAPIHSLFVSEQVLPEYLENMLSEQAITQAGLFNPEYVSQLLSKMKTKKQVSEIDNMAITAILSTQILNDLFINRSILELDENELICLNKTILDY